MPVLVGKKAPDFSAPAVVNGGDSVEDFSLRKYHGKKYVVFFFYPADFTFVCPTELLAFQTKIKDFEERNAAIVACSVDSNQSHLKWLQTEQNQGGIKGVSYPLVADFTRTISENYDVLAGNTRSYRGLFLIDLDGIVRHQTVNDMPLGRSVHETLRMLDALQYFEENGELCPVDWHKGDKGIIESHEGVVDYLSNI